MRINHVIFLSLCILLSSYGNSILEIQIESCNSGRQADAGCMEAIDESKRLAKVKTQADLASKRES